jgi:uncharacterized delta-60 repeat protein
MPHKPSTRTAVAALAPLLALFITAVAVAADSPGTISFTSAAYDVDEGAGKATITLTCAGGTSGEVAAKVSVANGTAGAADYLKPGEIDPSFVLAANPDSVFGDALALQPDGKVLIGQSGTVLRLLPDGGVDPSFAQPVVNGGVASVAVLPDGKIIIGGAFTVANDLVRNRVARLNPDGSLDSSFNGTAGVNFNDLVNVVTPLPDGKVMAGGDFTNINGVPTTYLARLNPDGTLDAGFTSGGGFNVYSMAAQPDGKVIAGGFELYRYNTDGSIDTTFSGGVTRVNSAVLALAIRPNGKVIIAGQFTDVGGVPRAHLAQLNSDGSLDASFNPGTGTDSALLVMAL